MRTLEELVGVQTTTDISAILPKIILDAVEEAARARRFGRALVRINTDLVGKPGRSINVPVRGTAVAERVGEGVEKNAFTGGTSPAYSTIPIIPFKIVSFAAVTQEAVDGSQFDLIRDYIKEAGEALADLEDTEILWELMARTAYSVVVATGGVIAGGTWIQITATSKLLNTPTVVGSVTGAFVVSKVDYFDGWFKLVAATANENLTITGYKSARTWIVDASTFASFTYEDIVKGQLAIRTQKFSPNFMLLHPNQMADLIKDNRFIDVSRYGSAEAILTGEIGKIGGMKLLVTTNMYDGVVAFLDSTRAAYLVIKRNIDLKRWDSPRSDSVELYFYFEFAPKVVNEGAICLALDSASNSLDHT